MEILTDYLPLIVIACFVIFVGVLIYFSREQKKWLKENSPLEWKIFGEQKNIDISNIRSSAHINIFQDTEDIFICSITCNETKGKWEYKYTFEKKLGKYIFRGHKVTFYDSTSYKNNKSISTGSYSSD